MRLTVFKGSEFIGVFEKGQYCPINAKSVNELKTNAVCEVYRYCAFFEKKLPSGCDEIEIIKTISIKNVDEIFTGKNFTFVSKKDFENLIGALYQTAFSFKIIVESYEEINLKEVFSFITDVEIDCDEQIMSYVFKIIEKAKELNLTDGYAFILKTYYFLTSKAKIFYLNKKEKGENISNLFCFGI